MAALLVAPGRATAWLRGLGRAPPLALLLGGSAPFAAARPVEGLAAGATDGGGPCAPSASSSATAACPLSWSDWPGVWRATLSHPPAEDAAPDGPSSSSSSGTASRC